MRDCRGADSGPPGELPGRRPRAPAGWRGRSRPCGRWKCPRIRPRYWNRSTLYFKSLVARRVSSVSVIGRRLPFAFSHAGSGRAGNLSRRDSADVARDGKSSRTVWPAVLGAVFGRHRPRAIYRKFDGEQDPGFATTTPRRGSSVLTICHRRHRRACHVVARQPSGRAMRGNPEGNWWHGRCSSVPHGAGPPEVLLGPQCVPCDGTRRGNWWHGRCSSVPSWRSSSRGTPGPSMLSRSR